MTKIRSFLSRFQLQYRRTSTLNKVVIAAAIVLSSLTLLSLRLVQQETEQTLTDLRRQAAVLDQSNDGLADAKTVSKETVTLPDEENFVPVTLGILNQCIDESIGQ